MYDLTDAIDLHVHTAPDVYPRALDDVQLVRQAQALGMKAVMLKSHHTLTADRASLAASQAEFPVFGGLVLNQPVGGLNPVAVETAIEFGARQIWMPTIHAQHCLDVAQIPMFQAEVRRGRRGLVVSEKGRLKPHVLSILEIIRDAEVILGTGHLAPQESLVLIQEAHDLGLKRILVTHPLMSFTRFSLDQMQTAVALGATLEFDYLSCNSKWPHAVDPDQTAAAIQHVGPQHCVMATDGGQVTNPDPPQMFSQFATAMSQRGIRPEDLRMMMCQNPAQLLGL